MTRANRFPPSARTLWQTARTVDQKRSDVLLAARKLLESKDFYLFTLDTLARDRVLLSDSSQTSLEPKQVFSKLSSIRLRSVGMDRMRSLMMQPIAPKPL